MFFVKSKFCKAAIQMMDLQLKKQKQDQDYAVKLKEVENEQQKVQLEEHKLAAQVEERKVNNFYRHHTLLIFIFVQKKVEKKYESNLHKS